MRAAKFTLCACVFFSSCLLSFAQTSPTYSGPQETYPGGERIIGRDLSAHNDRLRQSLAISNSQRSEPRVIKSGPLAPSEADIQAHKTFLSLKNTGLLRLLPRGAYNIKLRGNGAYYSFAYKTHEYGWGSDISLDIGLLSTGFAGADFGILTNLGDVVIESLDLEDSRVGYLADYKPPRKDPDARTEMAKITKGFTRYGMLYARYAAAEVDSTYLLRSIVYNTSDVLVAFRVTRIDTDGSVIIAWRLLKKYSTPKLSRS